MKSKNILEPNLNDGRLFISPILGCSGSCTYCYLKLHDYHKPRKNMLGIDEMLNAAQQIPEFILGKNGTIISVGAWGDIFPKDSRELTEYSIKIIVELLSWGNPVQIMSKNSLSLGNVDKIIANVKYYGHLLYSTTITTLNYWKNIEPNTSSPEERLSTCLNFHNRNIPTNVLIKPYFSSLTGLEIESIANVMLKYNIDYCTVGIFYWDENILSRMQHNNFTKNLITIERSEFNHLDCNGDETLNATSIENLIPVVNMLNKKGIHTFLKSSCVDSNILHVKNPSMYFTNNSPYCIKCGNCQHL